MRGIRGPLLCAASMFFCSFAVAQDAPKPPRTVEERLEDVEAQLEEMKKSKKDDPYSLRAYYKDGFFLETADKKFRARFGGRIHFDVTMRSADKELDNSLSPKPSNDAFDMRRVRMFMEATLYEDVFVKIEVEYEGGATGGNNTVALTDVFIAYNNLGPGAATVGHFYEPMGLEEMTSDNYITFIERAPTTAFNPGRNAGGKYQANFFDNALMTAAGIFRTTDGTGDDTGEDHSYNFTGRVACSPLYTEHVETKQTRSLLHIAAAMTDQMTDGESVTYSYRPVNPQPNFVTTGAIAANNVVIGALEGAAVFGPFSVQGEWNRSAVQQVGADNPDFTAWYVYASWFLTGESRQYRRKDAIFDRVRPLKNFGLKTPNGCGAWELAGRADWIDLTSKSVSGGEMEDYTVGLTWHWNPNTRIFWNFIQSHIHGEGSAQSFVTRFSIDF